MSLRVVDQGGLRRRAASPVRALPAPARFNYTPRAAVAAADPSSDKNESWWQDVLSIPGQFVDAGKGIMSGAAQMAVDTSKGVWKYPSIAARGLWNAATGDEQGMAEVGADLLNTPIGRVGHAATSDNGGELGWRDYVNAAGDYVLPGSGEMASMAVDSVGNTLGRFRHPSRYLDAFHNQTIVAVGLEDASNIALAAGGAGAVAKAASGAAATAGQAGLASRLTKVADAASNVQKVADTVGAFYGAPKAAKYLGGKAVTTEAAFMQPLKRRFPALLNETGRHYLTGIRNVDKQASRAANAVGNNFYEAATEFGLTPVEQGAITADRLNAETMVQTIADRTGLPYEQARQAAVYMDVPEQSLTAEIADTAKQYRERSLPAEKLAAMDGYKQFVDDQIAARTKDALEGTGRVAAGPLDPRQQGSAPMIERVDAELRARDVKTGLHAVDAADGVDKTYREAVNIIADDPARAADFPSMSHPERWVGPDEAAILDDILDMPMMYPAPWRPQMVMANRAIAQLEDQLAASGASAAEIAQLRGQIPVRPNEWLAAGGEQPRYLPGGESDVLRPRSDKTGRAPIRTGTTGIGLGSSEQVRGAALAQPYSARTIAEKLAKDTRRAVENDALVKLYNDEKSVTARRALTEDELQRAWTDALSEARSMRIAEPGKSPETLRAYGQRIVELLDAKGLELLDGDLYNVQVGAFNPAKPPVFEKIGRIMSADGGDMVVMPRGMRDRLIPYIPPKNVNAFLTTLAKMNSKFKGVVLPFSVRWQVGDAIGLYFMATQGGIDPATLSASMMKVSKLSPEQLRTVFSRLDDQSLSAPAREWKLNQAELAEPTTRLGKAWRAGGAPRRASFKFNAAMNRIGKQGYALAKLDDVFREFNLSLDDLSNPAWETPQVQNAIEKVIDDANATMGSFDDLTPFERRIVKEVLPFYAWSRHISRLAWRTSIDNPARMMWTLRLGTLAEEDPNLPDTFKGSIMVGDYMIPTNWMNPYNDALGGSLYSPTGVARSLSPAFKVAAAGLGVDTNKGLTGDLTRRYDGTNLDQYGRPTGALSLGQALPAMAYTALRQLPLSRELMNVLPTAEIGGIGIGPHARYGSGQLIVNRQGQPWQSTPRVQSLYGLLGLKALPGYKGPLPLVGRRSDLDPIIETRDKRIKAAERRARNTPGYEP